jgi:quercetin dioxygenase-like cupin family protein
MDDGADTGEVIDMTGAEPDEGGPGRAHNQPEVVWERWQKKRTFVRALEGTYSDLQKGLMDQKRVYNVTEMKWKGGPQSYGKHPINPQHAQVAQSIETHVHAFAPRGYAQNHGHMNSATFYVLRGKGYDIHDGERIDYEAGDMLLVENGCVHQHFNDSDTDELIVVVMKAKPLFLFMHMLFQKTVKLPPREPVPEMELYEPPTDW